MKFRYSVICVVILMLLFNSISFSKRQFRSSESLKLANCPIIINGNEELSIIALSGNGTINYPFIIENITIDGQGGYYCFQLNHISVNFIIRNCTFYNAEYCIIIQNCSNGELIDNKITNFNYIGIFANKVNNISFIENYVYNGCSGINLFNTSAVDLIFNSISYCQDKAVLLNCSNSNRIVSNLIEINSLAILLVSSDFNYNFQNSGENNFITILEINSVNNIFYENFIENEPELPNLLNIDFTVILLLVILGILTFSAILKVIRHFSLT